MFKVGDILKKYKTYMLMETVSITRERFVFYVYYPKLTKELKELISEIDLELRLEVYRNVMDFTLAALNIEDDEGELVVADVIYNPSFEKEEGVEVREGDRYPLVILLIDSETGKIEGIREFKLEDSFIESLEMIMRTEKGLEFSASDFLKNAGEMFDKRQQGLTAGTCIRAKLKGGVVEVFMTEAEKEAEAETEGNTDTEGDTEKC